MIPLKLTTQTMTKFSLTLKQTNNLTAPAYTTTVRELTTKKNTTKNIKNQNHENEKNRFKKKTRQATKQTYLHIDTIAIPLAYFTVCPFMQLLIWKQGILR